jgi:hypothetical protein
MMKLLSNFAYDLELRPYEVAKYQATYVFSYIGRAVQDDSIKICAESAHGFSA